jgi:hypothetical protein
LRCEVIIKAGDGAAPADNAQKVEIMNGRIAKQRTIIMVDKIIEYLDGEKFKRIIGYFLTFSAGYFLSSILRHV